MNAAAPRRFVALAGLPGAGLPHDRLARLAAREAFVGLKRDFLLAVDRLDDPRSAWLRTQVRGAETPEDLLLLRGPVFESLAGSDEPRRSERHALRRSLDSMFPDSAPRTGFMSF
ncbi:MAG: hypothetical protein ABIX12_13950 [Rubrivivax sp.]